MTDFLADYQAQLAALYEQPMFGLRQADKQQQLLPLLRSLHQHHLANSEAYHNMFAEVDADNWQSLADVSYLAVRLFKLFSLKSVPDEQIFKVLRSSGTTGQTPAEVFLDRDTSARQSKTLVKIMQAFIGTQRLPMLIIDSPAVLKDKALFSARGAGIQGMAFFGRDHTYALDENMQLDLSAIQAFAEKYAGQPMLVFGFTFMIWQALVEALEQQGNSLNLSQGVLVHSGGWKKLVDKQVDNATFKARLAKATGIAKVHNFYGMAEQVGSVFVECEQGHLHAPLFADVIVRNPYDLSESAQGEQGLFQVLSLLPSSYPGFSLLTEDLGRILGEDDCGCGRKGRYFAVDGRLPKTEIRGCSDTGASL